MVTFPCYFCAENKPPHHLRHSLQHLKTSELCALLPGRYAPATGLRECASAAKEPRASQHHGGPIEGPP